MPGGARVRQTFNQSESLARQNVSVAGFTASAGASGRGYDAGKRPPGKAGDLSAGSVSKKLPPSRGWIVGQVPGTQVPELCLQGLRLQESKERRKAKRQTGDSWASALYPPENHPAMCLVRVPQITRVETSQALEPEGLDRSPRHSLTSCVTPGSFQHVSGGRLLMQPGCHQEDR